MKIKILFAALLGMAAAVSQASFFNNSYTFNFTDPSVSYLVSNVYLLEVRRDPAYSFDYGFRLPGVQATAPNSATISDYQDILTAPATSSLIIAETNELPGDAPGQKHILLGMSNDAAGYAANIAWGTLFRNTNEDVLIDALDHYVDPDPTVTANALQNLVDFAYGDATTGILDNLSNSHSAWFTPGDSFSLMTWSDGKVVGIGTSQQVESVPEPAPLFGLGLFPAALLIAKKRQRRS